MKAERGTNWVREGTIWDREKYKVREVRGKNE